MYTNKDFYIGIYLYPIFCPDIEATLFAIPHSP